MLIEDVQPGVPLSSVDDDDEATRIAARLLPRMWRPAPEQQVLPSMNDWIESVRPRCTGPIAAFHGGG
jgi:streptomycin 6-kinase